MKVSGFTFVKNGISLGYPILESLKSLEPLCDEIVINVCFDQEDCKDDDGTYEYLRDNLSQEKYVFIKNHWVHDKAYGTHLYSSQTNKALEKCTGDICQYIQGDEALHEKEYGEIERGYKELTDRSDIDALLFHYYHFYGNVDAIKYTRHMYKREIRAFKNGLGIKSWLDAQGFRSADDQKLFAKQIDAHIYHYGWARKESIMKKKIDVMASHYEGGSKGEGEQFQYRRIWGVREFKGTHPAIVKDWVDKNRNEIDMMSLPRDYHIGDLRHMIGDTIEDLTGYRIGEYKNFRLRK